MAGKMTPVDVLLTEGNHRWHTSVTSEGTLNEGYSNVLQYFLSLLRAEGIICKVYSSVFKEKHTLKHTSLNKKNT